MFFCLYLNWAFLAYLYTQTSRVYLEQGKKGRFECKQKKIKMEAILEKALNLSHTRSLEMPRGVGRGVQSQKPSISSISSRVGREGGGGVAYTITTFHVG